MPLYTFQCKCGKKTDEYRSVLCRNVLPVCTCGAAMARVIAAPAVSTFKPYTHANLDARPVHIESKRQEREEFRKRGLVDAR